MKLAAFASLFILLSSTASRPCQAGSDGDRLWSRSSQDFRRGYVHGVVDSLIGVQSRDRYMEANSIGIMRCMASQTLTLDKILAAVDGIYRIGARPEIPASLVIVTTVLQLCSTQINQVRAMAGLELLPGGD